MHTKQAADQVVDYITHYSWRESRLGLERVVELLGRLGNPHKKLKYVHVAGTNGKGSTCAMLSSVLSAAGYRTGLYTSPFINHFSERIQVDGVCISYDELADVTGRVQVEADQMVDHPTEFELITAIAFLYFFETGCDIVVLEVGLGGRLDATNVIPTPEVAVITPISFDHTAELGDTLIQIAREKAGIIKEGGTIVISPQQQETVYELRKHCQSVGAKITTANIDAITNYETSLEGQHFDFCCFKHLHVKLLGWYQVENAAVVVTVVMLLRRKGWKISGVAVRSGLTSTKWPARFEILHQKPWFIVDGGHNPQCVDRLVSNLNTYFPGKRVTFITGVMADKDFEAMFKKIIPMAKRIFTVTPENPRALGAAELAMFFHSHGVQYAKPCKNIEQAIGKAVRNIDDEEVICAFGSFYMAGAIRRVFGFE